MRKALILVTLVASLAISQAVQAEGDYCYELVGGTFCYPEPDARAAEKAKEYSDAMDTIPDNVLPSTTTSLPNINGPAIATEPAVRVEIPVNTTVVPITEIGTPPEPYTPPEPVKVTLPETK